MKIIHLSALVLAIGFPVLVSAAGSETRQYCNDLYPADSYEAEDRNQYIQECLQAYGDAESSEPAQAEVVEDAPYYEGTVEEYIGEQAQDYQPEQDYQQDQGYEPEPSYEQDQGYNNYDE